MKNCTLYFLLLLLSFGNISAKELDKVSLQLLWLDQFQFAGYYMAKEKGFYKKAGLEVDFKKFTNNISPIDEVMDGKATFGIGRSSLLIDHDKGAKIALLYATFQSSPMVLLARKDSGITSIEDFKTKRIMYTDAVATSAALYAMESKFNLKKSDLIEITHTFNVEDLINKKTDLMASYISNEPFLMKEAGIASVLFDPKEYGFNFYSDFLFTSTKELQENGKRVEKFVEASLRGWRYAFDNIEETVEIILAKYNPQNKSKKALIYEANALRKLAYYKINLDELGHIEASKIQRIHDIYNVMGLVNRPLDVKKLIYHEHDYTSVHLNDEEILYLEQSQEIRMCVEKDLLPYAAIQNNIFVGIGADYMKLISKSVAMELTVVPTNSWEESLAYVKNATCDIVPLVEEESKGAHHLHFTKPLLEDAIVIATKKDTAFITDIYNIREKVFGVLEGCSYRVFLEEKYPHMKFINVASNKEGLKKVVQEKIYGFIGDMASVVYAIQHYNSKNLKINSSFLIKAKVSIGVRKDDRVLLNILNKALNRISEHKKREIYNSWVSVFYEKEIDYVLIMQIIVLFSLIILTISYFLIKESMLKRRLENQKRYLLKIQSNFDRGQRIAKVGVWELDYASNSLTWSTGIYSIFGIKAKNFQSTFEDYINYIHPDDREELKYLYKKSIKEKTDYFLEHRILTENGDIKYVEDRCENIFDSNGHIIRSIGTMLDITEKRRIYLKLEQLNSSLELRIDHEIQNNREKDKKLFAQSRLAQMGEMISMIAHQWRQPLGAISTTAANLEMKLELEYFDLNSKKGQEEQSEYFLLKLGKIEDFVINLSQTINDFRNFYKPNKVHVEDSLKSIVKKSLAIIESSLDNDTIKLYEEYDEAEKFAMYDSELMQVVLNIFKNAQDNFREKKMSMPQIFIKIKGKNLFISDNGGGIPEAIMEKIFDPYFSTKSAKNGTGLGLYMSKTIIEEHHNGKLHVQNKDKGVCFHIDLT
ncbi:ABC transporter substrate-binding protein [Sulfurimonas sp. SAG-AH-194-I05]|nr:ABC transporter substrate-binding protein [Sulfurimonas sp. SAG-AH-194-I05]MDF1875355.1 ABC transporter substrate-binding protein [Sulfurimonas sp. SAG-AH-194-I05]